MENAIQENSKTRTATLGTPYPVENIDECLEAMEKIVAEHGSGRPISKEEISATLNKKVATLSLFFSTLAQYGIVNLVHGKGYEPTSLYTRYKNPHDDNDPYRIKLQMFQNAPLYAKIIDNKNNHQLPSSEKMFANQLKNEPFNINENSADRAAKIFFENAKALKLISANNFFRFSLAPAESAQKKQEETKVPAQEVPKKKEPEDDLFTLPIPLPNKRKAFLRYPLDDLTKRDIRVIRKALDFIASSIMDADEEEEEIATVKKQANAFGE